MKYLDQFDIVSSAVKNSNNHAVYISNSLDFSGSGASVWEYVCEKITNLNIRSDLLHGGLFLFDTEVEAADFYKIFESGPVYASGIYALLIDNTGEMITENT